MSNNNDRAYSIGLAGSFTVDPLTRLLSKDLSTKGFQTPEFFVSPYNQLIQLSLNPDTILGAKTAILVILWRIEDITPNPLDTVRSSKDIDELLNAIKTLRDNYDGTIIISNPPYPSSIEFNAHDLEQPETGVAIYNSYLSRWLDGIKNTKGIKQLNLTGMLSEQGYKNSHDARSWYLYKQPYSLSFWKTLSSQITRIISAQTIAAKKCIVLDCDGTLWGGIVGEDGLGGIQIGEDFPNKSFTDFQHYLLHLRSKGLFLAIASKNNEEDVFEVFDKHDAMTLKREHISSWQVHWNSKADSIKAIANDLNIGTDSIVFIDDNPKEIAEVNERLPEVTCYLVPEELAELPSLLIDTGLFDISELTEEDKKRADMMLAESKRKSESYKLSEEEFKKSLELKIDIFEADDQHLGRITQLINKTNQFNLTTIRRNQDQVKALHEDSDILLMGMDIKDRFGEYGLVGVAIIIKETNEIWKIDSFMMSCRVLGRGAETSFLNKIAEAVKIRGGRTLKGQYIETKKNMLVKNLLEEHGFTKDSDNLICDVDNIKQAPDEVEIILRLKN